MVKKKKVKVKKSGGFKPVEKTTDTKNAKKLPKKNSTMKKISKKNPTIKKVSKKNSKRKVTIKKLKPIKITTENEREIAMNFASKVHKRFDTVVKATIFFGSQAKKQGKVGSDLDIVILIDDVSINWDLELISWYREELAKLVAAQKYSRDLHINTIKFSAWWKDLLRGDPVIINILRYGEPLIDIGGFFNPLKALLLQGEIHSTSEAVYAALQRAPTHLARSKVAEINAVEGIYWCMVDSAQAALMTIGKLPPSPEHITRMIKENFTDNKLLKMELVNWFRDVFTLHKKIMHGVIHEVKGVEIDLWQKRAEIFMKQMATIIDQVLSNK